MLERKLNNYNKAVNRERCFIGLTEGMLDPVRNKTGTRLLAGSQVTDVQSKVAIDFQVQGYLVTSINEQ